MDKNKIFKKVDSIKPIENVKDFISQLKYNDLVLMNYQSSTINFYCLGRFYKYDEKRNDFILQENSLMFNMRFDGDVMKLKHKTYFPCKINPKDKMKIISLEDTENILESFLI